MNMMNTHNRGYTQGRGFELESGSGKTKYIVLGAIALAFAVGVYFATSGKPKAAVASKPAAAATKASTAPANGGTAAASASAPAVDTAPAAVPATATAVAPADPGLAPQHAELAANSESPATVQPEPMAATGYGDPEHAGTETATADNWSSSAGSEETDESGVRTGNAEDSVPRPAVRKPAPSVLEAMDPWWRNAAAHDFNVQYVGQVAGAKAIAFRFSKSVVGTNAAASSIRITTESGAPANGNWMSGKNTYVLVYDGLQTGRYMIRVDAALKSADGNVLGTVLAGPIDVQ